MRAAIRLVALTACLATLWISPVALAQTAAEYGIQLGQSASSSRMPSIDVPRFDSQDHSAALTLNAAGSQPGGSQPREVRDEDDRTPDSPADRTKDWVEVK